MSALPSLPADLQQRLHRLLTQAGGRRCLLGIVGPPGAGKSTLAAALQSASPVPSQVVPMDGFHLANSELVRLGRSHRKGAPDTFDADGFVALLKRLRQQSVTETVYAPEYRREIEEAVAGAVAIPPTVPLLIVEGNYLLLDEDPWTSIAALLDETWYLNVDNTLRRQRLTARHEHFGRSPQAARAWAEQTDEPNARRIAACKSRAQYQACWNTP